MDAAAHARRAARFQGNRATATLTPLERPPEFAGREYLTGQEAAEYEKRTLEQVNSDRRDGAAEADLRRNYNEFWRDRGTAVAATRRTSLIVDPPVEKFRHSPLTRRVNELRWRGRVLRARELRPPLYWH